MEVAIVGGGAGGLLTGLLLARDGHSVTLLERDPEPPPAGDEAAWDDWARTGVTQFRQPHGFLGALCELLGDELADVWEGVLATDPVSLRLADVSPEPDEVPGDLGDRLTVRVLRRTTFERIVACAAEDQPNLDVRRGVAARGLVANRSDGVRVNGVVTDSAGTLPADLVIDSGGRRTAVPGWLDELGVATTSWRESDGFTYFSRWYRTHDHRSRELKQALFGGMAPGVLSLVFPGDAGVFGVAMVGLGSDSVLRKLRDPVFFQALASQMPALTHWVDPATSAAITDVIPMGAIQNRRLRFGLDGAAPSVAGIVNVGDSAMSTNPSLGRGIGLAALMARDLRDLLRSVERPTEVAVRFDEIKERRFLPYLADAVQADADLRAVFAADTGVSEPGEPSDRAIVARAALTDVETWKRWVPVGQLFDLPGSCLDDPELVARAKSVVADAPNAGPGMTRTELVDVLTGPT